MRSCKYTSYDLYGGGCQWQWQVCVSDTMISVCVYVSVSVCVCVIPVALFQVEFRVLFNPHHVNQGGVQTSTPQVTLYESYTTLMKSLSGYVEVVDTGDVWSCESRNPPCCSTHCIPFSSLQLSRKSSRSMWFDSPWCVLQPHILLVVRTPFTWTTNKKKFRLSVNMVCSEERVESVGMLGKDFFVWFLKEVRTSSRVLRLLTHRLPTHMLGHLGLFVCFTLSTLPFVHIVGITTVS